MPKTGMEPIRRQQVTEAVLKCVAEEGIDHITLDKTAARAGVSKGVVAYYFRNKKNLLLQSLQTFLDSYIELTGSFVQTSGEPVTAKEILRIIGMATLGILPESKERSGEGIIRLSSKENRKIMMQIYSMITVDEDYRAMVDEVYNRYLPAIVEVLEYGMERGEFRISEPETTAIQLMAILDGLAVYSIAGFRGTGRDHIRTYFDFLEGIS